MSSKARSKDPPATEPTSISSLPHDLLLNCLARLPRLYHLYPLSFVSKLFKSIVESPDFYKIRSLINRTERCLYLGLRCGWGPNTSWYTLCKNVNRGNSSGHSFLRIPSPNYLSATETSTVAVGSNIYQIGGVERKLPYKNLIVPRRSSTGTLVDGIIYVSGGNKVHYSVEDEYESSSSSVYVLDCRCHKWHQAPSMRVDRGSSTASLIDGKIYVAGGYEDRHSLDWFEVFDPKTQTWDSVPNPGIERRSLRSYVESFGLEGKFYLFWKDDVAYNPKEGIWNPVGVDTDMDIGRVFAETINNSYCVIDNILFFCEERVFKWYDTKVSLWKELHGLEEFPDLSQDGVIRMSDFGGNMAVLWFGNWQRTNIWCAEIALERRNGDEIWGKIEWFDNVLTLRDQCLIWPIDALCVTV